MKSINKQNLKKLARHLVETVIPNNSSGFTINPYNRELPFFRKDQYVVSINGYEKRLFYPIDAEEVFLWLCTNAHAFENRFIGGWHDSETDEFVLDLSVAIVGKQKAINFGLLNIQTDIYHPFLGKALPIIKREITKKVRVA